MAQVVAHSRFERRVFDLPAGLQGLAQNPFGLGVFLLIAQLDPFQAQPSSLERLSGRRAAGRAFRALVEELPGPGQGRLGLGDLTFGDLRVGPVEQRLERRGGPVGRLQREAHGGADLSLQHQLVRRRGRRLLGRLSRSRSQKQRKN